MSLAELIAREVDGQVALRVHERDTLMDDLTFEGDALPVDLAFSVCIQNTAQRMGVQTTARHVFGTREIAALHHEHALAFLRGDVSRYGSRTPASDYDDVEIALLHERLLSLQANVSHRQARHTLACRTCRPPVSLHGSSETDRRHIAARAAERVGNSAALNAYRLFATM